MKNCRTHFLLSAVLACALAPANAQTQDNDKVNQRAHKRAELRSALSAPMPPGERVEELTTPTSLREHQLTPQERADLRRQLREQFRVIGFDATQ